MNHPRSFRATLAVLVKVLLLFVLGQPACADDLKTWEKQLEQNYKDYKAAQEVLDNRSKYSEQEVREADLRQRQLMATRLGDLKRKIMRAGGDWDAIWKRVKDRVRGKQIPVPFGGTFRGRKDDENIEGTAPKELRPWKVTDPINRNAEGWARDKAIIQQLHDVLEERAPWLAKLQLPPKNDKRGWKTYLMAQWRPMFRNYRKKPKAALDEYDLAMLNVITDKWAKDTNKQEMIKAHLDRLTFKETLNRWTWLKDDEDFPGLKKRYEQLQDALRIKLLTKQEEWLPDEVTAYDTELNDICRELVEVEKRLVWLLGSALNSAEIKDDNDRLTKVSELKGKLHEQQRVVYAAWLNAELLLAICNQYPDTEAAGIGAMKREALKHATAAAFAYEGKKNELTKLTMTIDVRADHMRRGLERAQQQNTFRPRVFNDSEAVNLYSQLLSEEEYKTFYEEKHFFRMCNSYNDTYHEFFSNKEEEAMFLEQGVTRKNAASGR